MIALGKELSKEKDRLIFNVRIIAQRMIRRILKKI